ncbi:cyclic nucleotide-binding protein [Methylocella silvestris BL2]|uniref:Cyclic nucleotide-binding protein n=1 Tax=Methylocella silvestris (strain DSM 15510 / CIP 108128 / LMG 27833 / NCIMB 13906 / BL2) TaxID=395965 RepID=B8EQN9_METSB|nr:cyclic nucleotide-binding domain-containing protein [Methylocella silvestris]ACK49310.1 cyclic nucleotide-binding protein [Methylocella silvestris BL2]
MALEDDVAKLKRNATFAALEPDALRLLAFSAETKVLRAGDILFRRDEPSNCGFLLLSGSIALDPSGDGSAAARILRPPALIGEIALITETLRPATAIAREPSTVLRLSQQMFRRVLSEYPQSAERLRLALAARLAEFTAEIEKAWGAPSA